MQEQPTVPRAEDEESHPLSQGLTDRIKQVVGWQKFSVSEYRKKVNPIKGRLVWDGGCECDTPVWNLGNNEKEYTCYVPEDVPWEDSVFGSKEITFVGNLVQKGWNRRGKDAVYLNWQRMKWFYGPKFIGPLVRGLIDKGVIERVGGYVKGVHSYGYRLTPEYRDMPKIAVRVRYPVLARKCMQIREQYKKQWEGDEILAGQMDAMDYWKLDEGKALEAIEKANIKETQKLYALYWLNAFKNGDKYAIADGTSGRIFSNICNCPKLIRYFLYREDGQGVEVDLSESQPLMMLALYDEDSPKEERNKFESLVTSGNFYEQWADAANLKIADLEDRRRNLKVKFFAQTLFCKIPWYHSKMWEAFKREFPWMAKKMTRIKAADYTQFPIMLQRIEGDIIIRDVLGGLTRDGYKVLTVHDSFICKKSEMEEVKRRIKEAIRIHLGSECNLKVKELIA